MKICVHELDATSRCPQLLTKNANEWLYTDDPTKLTPRKLNVNFWECVIPAGVLQAKIS